MQSLFALKLFKFFRSMTFAIHILQIVKRKQVEKSVF